MNTHTLPHRTWETSAIWRRLGALWRGARLPEQTARHQTLAGLTRIAETSPHLLADVGLVRDPGDEQIWRCHTLGIVIVIDDSGSKPVVTVTDAGSAIR